MGTLGMASTEREPIIGEEEEPPARSRRRASGVGGQGRLSLKLGMSDETRKFASF